MTDRTKILLIEDDPNLGFILQENLEMKGYAVELRDDGASGLETYQNDTFDLCLIDVMLPKKDGFSVAKAIRKQDTDTPIFFLTAKSLREDRIEGFKVGADDYITKPFSMEELVLRIQAVLRRSQKNGAVINAEQQTFKIGKYLFDAQQQTLTCENSSQKLTAKEADLLRLLCNHQNGTLALEKIWGEENYFTGRSMDVFVSKLRKYLANDPAIEIRNIHGRGFKLIF